MGSSPMVLKHRYLYGPAVDQILAQEDATVTYANPNRVLWFLGDDQNTTHDLVDNTGTAVTGGHYEYGSFGNVTNVAADLSLTRYFYTGRELDTATGEQYNRERWYDSSTGRWLSEDPIGRINQQNGTTLGSEGGNPALVDTAFADGPNPYIYVKNSPTNATDPDGEDRRVMFFGHAWIEVDVYDPAGNRCGAVELHFSPSGYDNVPTGSTYPRLPISVWESTPEQDRELIQLWENLNQARQANGWLNWNPVFNCWIPVFIFADYGRGPGPRNRGWEGQGNYGNGGMW